MPLLQVNLIEEGNTPEKKIATDFPDAMVSIKEQNGASWAWEDIEDVLSDEWEIGGLAMPTDAIRALVAGE
jgi:4-oxalocrotonate tautomerase